MRLKEQIDKMRSKIQTDDYSMSIGEWMSIYRDGEIDIHPEFQRFFRWSRTQKTKLIESILLGIPMPPIFVSQRKNGKWDVIDGLQRLGTIFEFGGILRDEEGNLMPPLVLEGTRHLPLLENKVWDESVIERAIPPGEQRPLFHVEDDPPPITPFTQPQRLFVKRAKIGVSIILKESDEKSKYELFQRLNTGGTLLSNQEVRNCLLIMTDRDVYHWVNKLAEDQNFQICTPITEYALQEQYNLELVLRFLSLKNLIEVTSIGTDVNEFLTEEALKMAQDSNFDYEAEERIFRDTFQILANALSDNAFKRYDKDKKRFTGGFLIPAFETIASGIGYNSKTLLSKPPAFVEEQVRKLWRNDAYLRYARGGIPASSRIPKLIPLGRKVFSV